MIVDTHLHLIDRSALAYPWLEGAGVLNRDFRYGEYALEAHRCGISSTLHMEVDVEPSQQEQETSYVARLAAGDGDLLRGAIASCRPESPGFAAYLERQIDNSFVKGLRRVLHVTPPGLSEQSLFRENIRRLEGAGLTYDLIFKAEDLPSAAALVDAAPGVQFIIDHFGSPNLLGGREQPWWSTIGELARRPNVVAKISGIVAYTDPAGWTVESLRPFFEHAVSVFGWDRLVWGSDWPVCNLGGGLPAWVAATHALIDGVSEGERAALLSANARRVWKLDQS
ncbi:MAG: amidohydrolase [Rhizobiaceae bacterium]|nr:amidohydrolase [Rhizobiaceae bacterium]